MNRKLVIDFETFLDKKAGYHLDTRCGGISVVEYVRGARFKVHGFGFQWLGEEGKPKWVSGNMAANLLMVLPWKEIDLIAHNTKFDAFVLKEHYGYQPASFICTKAMSKATLGKRVKNHSLGTLAKHFSLEDKGQMKTDGLRDLTSEQEAELAAYCLHDVELCAAIYHKLKEDFPENQYRPMNWTIKSFVVPQLVLDVPLLTKTAKDEAKRKKEIFSELKIEKSEFSSNPKFMALLQKEGFEVPMKESKKKKNEDGTPMLIPALALGDEDFLELLGSENERLRTLCEARVAAKSTIMETRSGRLAAIGKTGTWPFDVEFSGADRTHRYSGGGAAGGNPQNFVKDSALRQAVRAPEGYKLIVADFAAIEFRLVAYLAKDPLLVESIEKGLDPYCGYGTEFYGRVITKEDLAERAFSKEVVLACGYGMGWSRFQNRVKVKTGQAITEEEAQKAVNLYRERYQTVPDLWYRLGSSIGLMTSGIEGQLLSLPIRYGKECLILPSGLKLQYPNIRQELVEYTDKETGEVKKRLEWVFDVFVRGKLEKKRLYGGFMLENICQALAGELTKAAIDKFDDEAVGQVHDEALLLADEFIADDVAKELEAAMSESPSWMPQMKLKAEVGYSSNWLDAKR